VTISYRRETASRAELDSVRTGWQLRPAGACGGRLTIDLPITARYREKEKEYTSGG